MAFASIVHRFVYAGILAFFASTATAENQGALPSIPFASLSEQGISNFGKQALAINPAKWKHAETENFIYHYYDSFVATPVSLEAEYYYRVIAKELEKDTSKWERKCHIFIFQTPEDWKAFQGAAQLDPWTGGLHVRNELFLLRDAQTKWKDNTLGHEITHLVLDRFFGANIPLWINEGYAEYVSVRAYSSYMRARGINARPRSFSVPPSAYIPVTELAAYVNYPEATTKVITFYQESERLVRYLSSVDKPSFLALLKKLSEGAKFDSAFLATFGGRISSLAALDEAFKVYASKDAKETE